MKKLEDFVPKSKARDPRDYTYQRISRNINTAITLLACSHKVTSTTMTEYLLYCAIKNQLDEDIKTSQILDTQSKEKINESLSKAGDTQ